MSRKSQNQRRLADIHLLGRLAKQHYISGDYESLCALCDRVQDLRVQIAMTKIVADVQEAWDAEMLMRTLMVQTLIDNLRDTRRKLIQNSASYDHAEVLKRLDVIEGNIESIVGNSKLLYSVKEEASKIRGYCNEV